MKKKSYHHYCDCAHPCMSFSTNPFKTGNAIPKEFVKWKTKGKRNKSFCELRLTEDQNVLQKSGERGVGIQKEVAGKQRQILTKLEHFVNVHQITFKKTREMRSEDQLRFVFFFYF